MKRPNITTGPWINNADTVYMGQKPAFLAVCSPWNHPQSVANARAIAALPALLEALELQSQVEGPSMTLLYDEEGVEGWQWEHPATGQTWTAISQHDEPAPFFPPVKSALTLAGYEF